MQILGFICTITQTLVMDHRSTLQKHRTKMVCVLKGLQFKYKKKHTHRQGSKGKLLTAAWVMISIQWQPVSWFLFYSILEINFLERF